MKTLAIAVQAICAVALVSATLERRGRGRFPLGDLVRDLFPRPRARWAWGGVAAGAALVVLPLGTLAAYGWIQWEPAGAPSLRWIALGALTVAVVLLWAAMEKLIFRGALLQQIVRRAGPGWGVALGAILFGLAHARPTEAGGVDWMGVAVRAVDGLGFGIAFLATQSLWVPTRWHASKNVCVWLFASESTLQLTHGWLRAHAHGPAPWVGGPYVSGGADLLASVAAVFAVACACRPRLAAGRAG